MPQIGLSNGETINSEEITRAEYIESGSRPCGMTTHADSDAKPKDRLVITMACGDNHTIIGDTALNYAGMLEQAGVRVSWEIS